MNFPIEILPKESYKIIDCDLSKHYLVRFTNTNDASDLINPETGLVKHEHICSPRDHVVDLSTNLLGVFELSFIQIRLTEEGRGEYNFYCAPNEEVDTPLFERDFVIDSNRLFWVLQIGKVHNTLVDYTKSNLPFKAKCIVIHTPMKWNYWHFSIRWKTEEGFWNELGQKEREKLGKRLAHEARVHLTMFARVEEPNYYELEKECYLIASH
jgi:hypothetical protein